MQRTILWVSNAPSLPNAYAQQTALFVPRLRASGHEVTIFATAGCEGAPSMMEDGTLILPRALDRFGNDIVLGHAKYVNANLVITLIDPHVLAPEVYSQLNWCAWAPIDCTPPKAATIRSLQVAKKIWSPSKFGVAELQKAGFQNVSWVPHGFDPEVFKPGDKRIARERLGIDSSTFVVTMVAANRENPPRKGFREGFQAFKIFSENVTNSLLYVHAEAKGIFGGIDLYKEAEEAGIRDKVLFSPQYHLVAGFLGPIFMAVLYQASDVFLSASHGEGFCLPIVEASACEVPVIAPGNSSQQELVSTEGQVSSILYRPDPEQPFQWAIPNISELAGKLFKAREGKIPVRHLEYEIDHITKSLLTG